MATNLVSLVMQFLTPDMIGRIASALGLNRNSAQTAIAAAVPALLAGFSGVAVRPEGAQKLVDATRQQSNILGSFASMIGGQGQTSMIEKGTQMLSSLLGGQDQTALAGAIGKFAGLGQGPSGSLLGMLAPVVMGAIGKQISGPNLNASTLTSLLADQKDNIAAALPSGFANMLGGTGLLESLGGAARAATAAGGEAARGAASAAYAVGNAGQRAAGAAASGLPKWLYWLIAALAAAVLLFYLFGRPAEQVVQPSAPAVPSLTVSGLDVGKQVVDSISSLRTTLGGITDAASAQAALPKLREVTAQVGKVSGMVGQLTADQRKALATIVNPLMPTINQLFDKVLAIPGVAEILKPAIDALRANLAVLVA